MAKEKTNRYGIQEIATQTDFVIVDTEQKDDKGNYTQYTILTALTKIMNDMDEIKKSLG